MLTPLLAFYARWQKGMEVHHSVGCGYPGIVAGPPPGWVCVLGSYQLGPPPGFPGRGWPPEPPVELQLPQQDPRLHLGQSYVSLLSQVVI